MSERDVVGGGVDGGLRCVAADAVTVSDGDVLFMKRDTYPCSGCWVLPGGMVERNETTREACRREVREEVGIEVGVGGLVGVFDDPGRDERGNVSVAYLCAVREGVPSPVEESSEVGWFSPGEFDEIEFGFDHGKIVTEALNGGGV